MLAEALGSGGGVEAAAGGEDGGSGGGSADGAAGAAGAGGGGAFARARRWLVVRLLRRVIDQLEVCVTSRWRTIKDRLTVLAHKTYQVDLRHHRATT